MRWEVEWCGLGKLGVGGFVSKSIIDDAIVIGTCQIRNWGM